MGVLNAVQKAYNASSNLSDHEARFSPTSSQECISNHDLKPQLAHLFVGDTRWRD
ncbi:hypothetical protein Tco_0061185, partial [Tanacetum coccineum]